MKFYTVKSYDGAIEKEYTSYGWAYKFMNKLVNRYIDCGIWLTEIDDNSLETIEHGCIIGC